MIIKHPSAHLFSLKVIDGMGLLSISGHPVAVARDQDQLDTACYAAAGAYNVGRMDALNGVSAYEQNDDGTSSEGDTETTGNVSGDRAAL